MSTNWQCFCSECTLCTGCCVRIFAVTREKCAESRKPDMRKLYDADIKLCFCWWSQPLWRNFLIYSKSGFSRSINNRTTMSLWNCRMCKTSLYQIKRCRCCLHNLFVTFLKKQLTKLEWILIQGVRRPSRSQQLFLLTVHYICNVCNRRRQVSRQFFSAAIVLLSQLYVKLSTC